LNAFWTEARSIRPDVDDESGRAGTREGQLGELFSEAGLTDIDETELVVEVEHTTFDEWWEPFTLGVAPAGVFVADLDPQDRELLRLRCNEVLGPGPVTIRARAWAVRGRP
jgi:hypothetical protein